MKIGLTVRLSREDITYSAGELIEGNVCLDTQQEIKLKGKHSRIKHVGKKPINKRNQNEVVLQLKPKAVSFKRMAFGTLL